MPTQFMNVVSVRVLPDYVLALEFEDGEKKIYDFKQELKHPVFAPLKDKKLFRKAKSVGGGIIWNEDIDIASEYLYDNGIPVR